MPLSFWRKQRSGDLVLGRLGSLPFSPVLRVPFEERKAHTHVIGISGMGKSKFLESCVFQDIANGQGCGLIDPHSLLVEDLLKHLVTRHILDNPAIVSQLIYVDPSREDYVIPFNVLATEDKPYAVATSVLEAFRRTWPESLREAPHFSNIMFHALLVLIHTRMTLMDLPRLLVDKEWRDELLIRAGEPKLTAFFHDRYEQWGRDGAVMRESTLNKVTALSINPYLEIMLGQQENHLDFRAIMDEGKILLLSLGNSDPETRRLIGSLVVTGLELAMRRRQNRNLWNLTIDEFAGYVANEGSAQTLEHVLSEGRKFRMTMTVAHQTLSQLTANMIGALGNVHTKIIFGIGRYDAEYFAKITGRVDTQAVKRDPKTDQQHEVFSPLAEQWEDWTTHLQHQPPRHATIAMHRQTAVRVVTLAIPMYRATEEQVSAVQGESLRRYGIAYSQAKRNLSEREGSAWQGVDSFEMIPAGEPVPTIVARN
jgi:hypothetical protein